MRKISSWLLLAMFCLIPQAASALSASSIPTKIPTYWGQSAGAGYITCPIPIPSQITITAGRASWTDGFPPVTFSPVGSGGVPPFGQDFNGAFCQLSQWTRWQNAGGPLFYDSVFSSAVSGYPNGAVLANASTPGCLWVSTADNNRNDPDTGGSNWLPFCTSSAVATGTSSGTNAQTVTVAPFVLKAGVEITFKAGGSNTLALTVNANSTGAINVYRRSQLGASLTVGGEVVSGQMVTLEYDGTEWQCMSCEVAHVGQEYVFTGTTAPAGYQIEDGSCIPETTYADLYGYYASTDLWGTQATAGGAPACSGGNFHVKFANGTASVAANNQGVRTGPLTLCTAGVGNGCGSQTLARSALPNASIAMSGSQTIGGGIFVAGTGDTVGSGPATFNPSGSFTINGSNFNFNLNGNVTQTTSENPVTQNILAVKL